MILGEAIAILREDIVFLQTEDGKRLERAEQLGIEALERLKDLRGRAMAMYSDHIRKRLPSETEE